MSSQCPTLSSLRELSQRSSLSRRSITDKIAHYGIKKDEFKKE